MGDPFAEGSRRLSHHFAGVNLIHSRRVRRRNLSAKGCPPDDCLLLTNNKNSACELSTINSPLMFCV
ncbi:MAG: hypothetical protein LBK82_05075 [Planctomycetaceae bacterium]|nr:hypothetical protein [Planctomycetaceae bacterium]